MSPHGTRVKCFVKDEGYPKYKHARGIYARVDEFKVLVGPVIKEIENELYKHPSFIKHVPVEERPRYILDKLRKPGAVYLATDYTAFESHFTPEMMNAVEFELYRYMGSCNSEANQILDVFMKTISGVNRCTFGSKLEARLRACRMSGEMNTSLGNGFSNYMFYLFSMSELGVPGESHDCVIEGDDCLAGVILPRNVTPDVVQGKFTTIGLNIKMEVHYSIGDASFCGLVFDENVLTNVVDPVKQILNFGWIGERFQHSSAKTRTKLLRGKAISLLCSARGCPVLQPFALKILELTKGYCHKKIESWTTKHCVNKTLEPIQIQWGSREVMERVFKISVVDQLALEKEISQIRSLSPFHLPTLDHYIGEDCFHYYDHYTREEDMGWDLAIALPFSKYNL